MTVPDLLLSLRRETETRSYIRRLEILDQSASLLKARLYIAADLFVQVYRNDRFDTTNLVLLHNGQRVYARDQLGASGIAIQPAILISMTRARTGADRCCCPSSWMKLNAYWPHWTYREFRDRRDPMAKQASWFAA